MLIDRSRLYPERGLAGALPTDWAVHTSVHAQAKLRPAGGQLCAQRRSQSKWNPERAGGAAPQAGAEAGQERDSGLAGRRRPAGSTPRPTGAAHTLRVLHPPRLSVLPGKWAFPAGAFRGPGGGREQGRPSPPLASISLAPAAGGPAPCARSYTSDAPFFGLGVIFNKYFLNVCYVLGAGNTGGKVCGPALEGVVFNGAPDSKQTISYLPQGGGGVHSRFSMNECLPGLTREQPGLGRLSLRGWGHGWQSEEGGGRELLPTIASLVPQSPGCAPGAPGRPSLEPTPTWPAPSPSSITPAPDPLPEASPSPPSWKRFCCLQRSCVAACEL